MSFNGLSVFAHSNTLLLKNAKTTRNVERIMLKDAITLVSTISQETASMVSTATSHITLGAKLLDPNLQKILVKNCISKTIVLLEENVDSAMTSSNTLATIILLASVDSQMMTVGIPMISSSMLQLFAFLIS